MDILILSTIAVGAILLLLIIWFVTRGRNGQLSESVRQGDNILPGARRRQLGVGRNARQGRRRSDDEEEEDEPALEIDLPEGKVGAKKLAKLQAKAERKHQREIEERDRQERKKLQEREDEQRKKVEEQQKLVEQKKEDEEKKIREEQERKEHQEYLKMKEAFSVESEGFEEGEAEGTNALQDFVDHIKRSKVVVMEDIAAQFKLKTQQAIDRIQTLQADGILTGVIDDRGKFIYISREELEAVSKFVKLRGRVSISELVDNSNRLINLTPVVPSLAS